MKKIINIFILVFALQACNYLDIVPDNTAVLEDAFTNENTAENFLFSCYTKIPDWQNFRDHPTRCATSEVASSYEYISDWFGYLKFQQGKYSASEPVFNEWTNCYMGIRQCFMFLENLESVTPANITQAEFEQKKIEWRAEAKFLIAYYHYVLLQHYGPVVIVESLLDFTESTENLSFSRLPYDECVERITAIFEEAIPDLPVTVSAAYYGKPTQSIAKALISRMHLYAASPLFNGNTRLYSNFKDTEGNHLVSQSYDKEKWKTALDVTAEAIRYAEAAGRELLQFSDIYSSYSELEQDAVGDDFKQAVSINRYVMTEPWNKELIWGYSNWTEYLAEGSQSKHILPRGLASGNELYGSIGPTLDVVKLFYTKNGLPIDVDPDFDMNQIFTVPSGENTAYLHLNREPRFYSWIGYDCGEYPVNDYQILYLKAGETNGAESINGVASLTRDQLYTGYALAKMIHPATVANSSVQSLGSSWPFPLIRLAELYLNYAEAYVEYNGKLDGQALTYVNAIRKRAGLPDIQDSYGRVGGLPSGDDLVDIIRREKTLEFLFEGMMGYDYRRWMIAHKEWAGMTGGMKGLDATGHTADEFYRETTLVTQPFVFSSKQYLFPITQNAIDINKKLVQNPGWGADVLPELSN